MSNDRIGFSKGKQLVSHLIMWLTDGKASHAFVVYYDEDFGADYIFEATTWGIRIVPYNIFSKRYNVIALFRPRNSLEIGFQELGRWLGRKYDFTGLVGMIWVLIGRWLKYKWRNPLATSKAMFCSEAVANVLVWSGYAGFELRPDTVSPKDLMKFCASGDFEKL